MFGVIKSLVQLACFAFLLAVVFSLLTTFTRGSDVGPATAMDDQIGTGEFDAKEPK